MQKLFPQLQKLCIAFRFAIVETFTSNLLAGMLEQWKAHLTTLVLADYYTIAERATTGLYPLLGSLVHLSEFPQYSVRSMFEFVLTVNK